MRIKGLYNNRTNLPPQDQHCFTRSIESWNMATIREMKQWINTHKNHIKLCLQQAKQRESKQLQDLRKWCPPNTQRNEIHPMTIPLTTPDNITNKAITTTHPKLMTSKTKQHQSTLSKFFKPKSGHDITQNIPPKSTMPTTTQLHVSKNNITSYIRTMLHKRKWLPTKRATNDVQNCTTTRNHDKDKPTDPPNASLKSPSKNEVGETTCTDTGRDINKSLKKFERWKPLNNYKSPSNNNQINIQQSTKYTTKINKTAERSNGRGS